MYSAQKLNKQGDNIQSWCTPFPILNQSAVPWLVLTVASWPPQKFHRRQVRRSGFPSLEEFPQFVMIHRAKGFSCSQWSRSRWYNLSLVCYTLHFLWGKILNRRNRPTAAVINWKPGSDTWRDFLARMHDAHLAPSWPTTSCWVGDLFSKAKAPILFENTSNRSQDSDEARIWSGKRLINADKWSPELSPEWTCLCVCGAWWGFKDQHMSNA